MLRWWNVVFESGEVVEIFTTSMAEAMRKTSLYISKTNFCYVIDPFGDRYDYADRDFRVLAEVFTIKVKL